MSLDTLITKLWQNTVKTVIMLSLTACISNYPSQHNNPQFLLTNPTLESTLSPSLEPSSTPTSTPTQTIYPTYTQTAEPTITPYLTPTVIPSVTPTKIPESPTPIPAEQPSPNPPGITGNRWIVVDLSEQSIYAYSGNMDDQRVEYKTTVSTGTYRTPTPIGTYNIWIKLRFDDMAGPGYYLPDVPYVMYFHRGYGIHGTYWHDNFGQRMSHGCVNLETEDAKWFFEFADVGTPVIVQE